MGATAWRYFTPYRANVGRALKLLQKEVFRSWDYRTIKPWLKTMKPPQASSIEELREAMGETGTHSILDIEAVGDFPNDCVAAPAPPEVLLAKYGTSRPTSSEIKAHPRALSELLERGRAYYVVVYKDDVPDELYFEGASGD